MADIEKIVIITRKTLLDELVERFNSRDQARFYIEHMGESFEAYQSGHDAYMGSLRRLERLLPEGVRAQFVDRAFVPNFLFGPRDLVVTLGPDGLVINTAKYLSTQPLLALNPDPARIDGIMVPFHVDQAASAIREVLEADHRVRLISMARADLNDGQSLCAVNDLFIGARTHVSARYRLALSGRVEDQSSSGIIVSTGAGSTAWFRSILTGAAGIVGTFIGPESVRVARESYRFPWDADYLFYSVREPFISNVSSADLVFGRVDAGEQLEVTSHMPQNGIIFSDGIEADYLQFNSGAIAEIGLAESKVNLVVPGRGA